MGRLESGKGGSGEHSREKAQEVWDARLAAHKGLSITVLALKKI